MTKSGKIYRGCNIENAAYGPSNCAERTAFFKAVSEGEREFTAIAIVGGRAAAKPSDEGNIPVDHPTDEQANEEYETSVSDMAYPCGVCRQVMREFCDPDTFRVIVAKSITEYEVRTLADLLPESFGPDNLK